MSHKIIGVNTHLTFKVKKTKKQLVFGKRKQKGQLLYTHKVIQHVMYNLSENAFSVLRPSSSKQERTQRKLYDSLLVNTVGFHLGLL